jgi:hexokinase
MTKLEPEELSQFAAALSQDFKRSQLPSLSQVLTSQFTKAHGSQISMIPMLTRPHAFNTEGHHLCIELGGSTLRISLISNSLQTKQKHWVLKDSQKSINAQFFDNIVHKCEAIGITRSVSIVWSFPTDDTNRVITMGKGWTIDPELQQVPLDEVFTQAFGLNGHDVIIKRVINDGVAVSLSGLIHESKIALILGTGVNLCLILNEMLYNVELGFFGSLKAPTKYDLLLDSRFDNDIEPYMESQHPIYQPFEKLTSGRYLGELLRLILLDIGIRHEPYELTGELFCEYLKNPSIRPFCLIILQRAAYYVRAALESAVVLTDSNVICYTGSFLYHCHEYRELIGFQMIHIENPLIGATI